MFRWPVQGCIGRVFIIILRKKTFYQVLDNPPYLWLFVEELWYFSNSNSSLARGINPVNWIANLAVSCSPSIPPLAGEEPGWT